MSMFICTECELGKCLFYNRDEKPTYCPTGQDKISVVLSKEDLINPDWFCFEDGEE